MVTRNLAQSYGPYIAHSFPLALGQQFSMLFSFLNTTCINEVWYENNYKGRGAQIVKKVFLSKGKVFVRGCSLSGTCTC